LVPRKAKTFKKEVAQDLNLSEHLIDKAVDCYWEAVRKTLVNMTEPSILLNGLGTFKIRHWDIDKHIEKNTLILQRIEGKFKSYPITLDLKDKLEKLKKMKELSDAVQEKLKKKKNEKVNKNLEKPETDI